MVKHKRPKWRESLRREFFTRCLEILAMPDKARLALFAAEPRSARADWFLENIDSVANSLHVEGFVEYQDFDYEPGAVVVTREGDIRRVVITDAGRSYMLDGGKTT